jgi:hypothetical protein
MKSEWRSGGRMRGGDGRTDLDERVCESEDYAVGSGSTRGRLGHGVMRGEEVEGGEEGGGRRSAVFLMSEFE